MKPGAGGIVTLPADVINRHIGAKLREHREASGLSTGQLAKLAGISRHTLMRYEIKGHPIPASTLMILATIMRVPINGFFEEESYTS